jgi:hypothetical protein
MTYRKQMTECITVKILLKSSNPKVSREPLSASYPSWDDGKAPGGFWNLSSQTIHQHGMNKAFPITKKTIFKLFRR